MILLTSMLRRLPHLTHEEFVAYHRGHHAPLFASTEAARKYVRRYTVEHPRPAAPHGLLAPSSFDAIVRMSFDSRADLVQMFISPSYLRRVRPDELRFFDHSTSEFFLSEEFIALDKDAPVAPLKFTVPALNPPASAQPTKRLEPQRWNPPKSARAAPSPIRGLCLFNLSGFGAEDVVVRPDGQIVTGLADGRIIALDPDTGAETTLADTGGRPLGIELHPDGGLIVCDSARGLLHVDAAGRVVTLVSDYAGQPLQFTNNAAVAADGTIYFSDSSQRFGLTDWLGDALEHRPTGRLFRHTADGTTDLLADQLAFANGVALSPDESFVVVAQTCAYDLQQITLAGPHQGARARFGAPLPGFPDNISTGQDGNLWVSLVAPRVPVLDFLLPRHPRWRKLLWGLPDKLRPQGEKPIHVRAYSLDGSMVHDLATTHPAFGNATGARQAGQHVWLGSIRHATLARFDLPSSTP
jgi:hypothetical protein